MIAPENDLEVLNYSVVEYTKTMKELSRWGDLMLDSLDGTCVFTPEQVKARLDAVQAKADEIANQVQQLEEKSRQMKPAAADLQGASTDSDMG